MKITQKSIIEDIKKSVGTGKPEWGAEPGKLYFVITWEA